MTAGRDAILDAVLTSTPKDAWQVIFEKLWEILSAPLTAHHAERELTARERKIGEIELCFPARRGNSGGTSRHRCRNGTVADRVLEQHTVRKGRADS